MDRTDGDGKSGAGRARRTTYVVAGIVGALAAAVAWVGRDVPASIGARPSTPPGRPARSSAQPGRPSAQPTEGGARRAERIARSPHFQGGAFRNTEPIGAVAPDATRKAVSGMLFGTVSRRPAKPVPVITPDPVWADSAPHPADGLHVTWYGHSTALVEIEGRRVLVDPVWSQRCSPSQHVGPRRLHRVPLHIEDLPRVDAIVISHDHYDHLDFATIRTLTRTQSAPFLVPLGVGAHLEQWGVPPDRITELDWDEETTVGGLRFVATAARHFSGRLFTRDTTLWASWVIAGQHRRVFYTGDTGYFSGYKTIGTAHGPFDVTIAQIGAYSPAWPDIHMVPEDAVTAHLELGGGLLIPVHWATFMLAPHPWAEPADRLWREAQARDVRVAIPRPGERIDVDSPPTVDGWWQAIA